MNSEHNYTIHLDSKFGYSNVIDVPQIIASCKEKWFNQTLCSVNDCVVRVGIVQGEFHWHKHDAEDEFFFVLEGKLLLDLKNETCELKQNHGYTVPKGVMHRTRAPDRTIMLMIEGKGVRPTGDE